jgi:Flp pilus assembly protein TadG
MRRIRTESGSAVIEFTWFSVLVFVPLVYIILAVFETQSAAYAVSNASAAAARAFVQAPSGAQAEPLARKAASITLADADHTDADVSIRCKPRCRVPGSTVTVIVKVTSPLPLMPRMFGQRLASITVDATHTEPFGTYRARS